MDAVQSSYSLPSSERDSLRKLRGRWRAGSSARGEDPMFTFDPCTLIDTLHVPGRRNMLAGRAGTVLKANAAHA
eukprot:3717131-Rhodomonas_salina.3